MNYPNVKKIVTKGDSNISVITNLGELKYVVARLSSTMNHLKKFVVETVEKGIEKYAILKQFNLIDISSQYIKYKIDYATSESGVISLIKRTKSRKRAASNLDIKIAKKMNRCKNSNYISIEDNILASIILDYDKKPTVFVRKSSICKVKTEKREVDWYNSPE